jgi:hypothetical protein
MRHVADAEGAGGDSTLVRRWLAIFLVGGLLIFVTLSFYLDEHDATEHTHWRTRGQRRCRRRVLLCDQGI